VRRATTNKRADPASRRFFLASKGVSAGGFTTSRVECRPCQAFAHEAPFPHLRARVDAERVGGALAADRLAASGAGVSCFDLVTHGIAHYAPTRSALPKLCTFRAQFAEIRCEAMRCSDTGNGRSDCVSTHQRRSRIPSRHSLPERQQAAPGRPLTGDLCQAHAPADRLDDVRHLTRSRESHRLGTRVLWNEDCDTRVPGAS
jgi:hypothetical protein